jgi:hypothetical protein
MKADLSKLSHQLIVAGLVGMIEDDGLTFHEAMDVLEDIKRQTFPALMEIAREGKAVGRPDVETIKEHDEKLQNVVDEIKAAGKAGEQDALRGD